nr:acetyl-CoA carboxylase biotin carboxyl carrier protein [uncultured Caproiciproducens sp.]
MDIQQIKDIAETMRENGLTLVEITEDGASIHLERNSTLGEAPPLQTAAQPPVPAERVSPCAPVCSGIEIKSPIVGVFYASASPEGEPFVKVGSYVKKGDTLCIIEAMKLLNEISAECDGEITEICAASGQVVEYAQVLFRIK